MQSIDKVNEKRTYDAFFCANGLEGRDTRVVEIFLQKSFFVKKWIIFHYKERGEEKDGAEGNVAARLQAETVIDIYTSYCDTRDYCEILQPILKDMENYERVGIDVTGFKNQFFFPIFKIFAKRNQNKKIDVFYTEPATYKFPKTQASKDYFPNMKDDSKVFFNYSKAEAGIEIKSIPGFEGEKAKSTVLVILLGFDGKVATRIKEEYNVEKVLLINGFPSYLPKFRDISLLNNKELVNGCNKEEIFNTYADNPFEVYNVLYRIQQKYSNHKLLIAPLGAKPLALGVCKFALDYPRTAVLYIESTRYVEKSTEDYGETWEYKLDIQ
jgi:hypothetical protein